jgi:hypothetical protein
MPNSIIQGSGIQPNIPNLGPITNGVETTYGKESTITNTHIPHENDVIHVVCLVWVRGPFYHVVRASATVIIIQDFTHSRGQQEWWKHGDTFIYPSTRYLNPSTMYLKLKE